MHAMADNTEPDASSPAEGGRTRRDPPTIDLEATDVTTAPRAEAATEPAGDRPQDESASASAAAERSANGASSAGAASSSAAPPASISPWVIAPFSGAVAAALVIAVGWMLGWPAVQAPGAAPQVSAAAVDDLAAQVATLEGRVKKSEEAAVALAKPFRDGLESLRAQQDKLAASVNELRSAPRAATDVGDLSGINDRIARLEQAVRAQGTDIAKAGEKVTDGKTVDDLPLRRVVAASLLDVAARHGDPFQSTLATAKALAPDANALEPLGQFAATGVPSPQMLGRELLSLVPKFATQPSEAASTGSGIIDRLQAGAAKLVQIERSDATGTDRGAVIARATSAALRNDIAEARHELLTLSAQDRAPAQAWLDKVAARDAALAASRQFADSAMAALANSGQ
jgi:hypothetical protein